MWIKGFRIRNFKSFDDSGWHQLDRHINLVVGQNHSGKTALLRSLAQRTTGMPHRSSTRRRGEPVNPFSSVEFEFVVSGDDLRDLILGRDLNLNMPIPQELARVTAEEAMRRVFSTPEISLFAAREGSSGSDLVPHLSAYPSVKMSEFSYVGDEFFVHFTVKPDRSGLHIVQRGAGRNDNFSIPFLQILASQTYYFDAQRVPQNNFGFGSESQLRPDAANLAQVLNILQSNHSEYAGYIGQVMRVIPLIKWVSGVPSAQHAQNVEIRVWNVHEKTGRDDLAIPLAECGTGIGQVLSILYVVFKASGSVVVIDEPNSFLHPRASKALMAILREDKRNQYIVTTHSPEIIAGSEPERLFALGLLDEKTTIKEVDRHDLASSRQVLDELGSRLSDVFGADRVIWVEGPTEVECFPLLIHAGGREIGPDVAIAPLRNTGDLESRHGEVIADIYRNLSSAHALLPSSLALSLDGDKRTLDNKKVLERAFGIVRFIPRRCYENYLIHPQAIAGVLNSLISFIKEPTEPGRVQTWIEKNGRSCAFKAENVEPFSPEWLAEVDAPKLLDALFQDLSGSKEIYRKPLHSVLLTKWLVANDLEAIRELVNYAVDLLPKDVS